MAVKNPSIVLVVPRRPLTGFELSRVHDSPEKMLKLETVLPQKLNTHDPSQSLPSETSPD